MAKTKELVSNRYAYHNYEVLEILEAGIALTGTEIKSLRDNGGNLQDNYIVIRNLEAWLCMSHIAPFKFGNINNHEDRRERKLLFHKIEIQKLKKQSDIKGLALIALAFYLNDKGIVKVKVGVCKGKNVHDKRETLKKRQQTKEIQKVLKNL